MFNCTNAISTHKLQPISAEFYGATSIETRRITFGSPGDHHGINPSARHNLLCVLVSVSIAIAYDSHIGSHFLDSFAHLRESVVLGRLARAHRLGAAVDRDSFDGCGADALDELYSILLCA